MFRNTPSARAVTRGETPPLADTPANDNAARTAARTRVGTGTDAAAYSRTATDVVHQRGVTPQQQLKGGFVALMDVAFQQFRVAGSVAVRGVGEPPQVANDLDEFTPRHDLSS
jgi:hypothetical protein